jgi:prolyl oligopeptidase
MKVAWIAVLLATFLRCATANGAARDPVASTASADRDPFEWLEDISGEKALEWVRARNAATVTDLASTPEFAQLRDRIRAVLDSEARIPYVRRRGRFLYNFWKDKQHPRGLWRRATLEEYKKTHPRWTVLIDLDALGKAEHENWVWDNANCLKPDYRHCLIELSRGGADATVIREYDLELRSFVKDGFFIPEAKNQVSWKDDNTLYIGTDFGPGSMTKSGYPRVAKLWKRGTSLASAQKIYEGRPEDLVASAWHDATPGFERDFISREIDSYTSETYVIGKRGELTQIDVQKDAIVEVRREWLLVKTRSPWTIAGSTYASGSLLAAKLGEYMAGKRELTLLFSPTQTASLASFTWTRHHLLLNILENVASRIEVLTPNAGAWQREPLRGAPELSSAFAEGSDPDHSDEFFLTVSGFLRPTSLERGVLGTELARPLKQSPPFFDSSSLEVKQYFAISKDNTRVPYFIVAPKSLKADGDNPTLLYGYGGFEISLMPFYSGSVGRAWLERGGVYVVANIRGGGEYGPRWHQAAIKQNRPRAYEDFAAVAQDLVARGITSAAHLGIAGGSNGGLLMGNMLTQYGQLFGAVVSEVPLLDMRRYTHLSAGASWIAEYGDPDKADEWKFVQTFSPYHNLKDGQKYPPTLFTTSTRDDRVGPAHARKMTAKMLARGADVYLYENIEGGHAAAADNSEAAFRDALRYTFLWNHVR